MKKKKVQVVIFHNAPSNNKEFLLLKMNERRHFLWQNITGGVDEGEGFDQAAIRESVEETNLNIDNIKKITPLDLEFHFVDQWKNDVHEKVFAICVHLKWDVKIDPNEHCDYKWVKESELTRQSVHFESNYEALTKAMKI